MPVGETSIALSAQAVDFAGNRGTSSDVQVIVLPDTDRPVVQLTAPTAPLTVPEGTVIQATATASDNVAVTRVEFLLNDVIVATRTSPPYEAFITLPIGPTTFRFSARAFDPAGNAGTAPEVVVNVTGDPAPNVRILTPASGTTVGEGTFVEVTFEATDNGAVMSTGLEVVVDGQVETHNLGNARATQLFTPFGATQITLTALATDNLGQVGRSLPVVLNVELEPAPTISFVTPVDGDTLVGGSTIRVVLDASDDVAVQAWCSAVTTFLSSPPYEFDVFVPAGLYAPAAYIELQATAFDDVGKPASVTLTLPITPDPLTALQGLVTDANGLPVEGATVTATSNGLTAEWFPVTSELTGLPDPITGTPDATRVISTPSMPYPHLDPFGFAALVTDQRMREPQAVIRLRGTLNVPADGVYDFRLVAFPAGRLTVNGIRIIDLPSFDNDNSAQQGSSLATLPAGRVPIEIITASVLGGLQMQVEWGPEGGRMQAIPLDALTPAVSPYRAVTGPDGSFTIENVPSVTGGYIVSATATASDGQQLAGASARTAPVPAGIADVGTIAVSPTLHPVSIPVGYSYASGTPRGIDVDGNALVAAGNALEFVRLDNVERPFVAGGLLLPGEINDVRASWPFAFVAGGSAGLHVVNTSVFYSLFLDNSLPLGGDAQGLALHENRLYVANGAAGLSIVDVSNPSAPAPLGATAITGGARRVALFGGHYAAVIGDAALTLVDVANAAAPQVVATLAIDDARSVVVTGRTVLVGTATALVGVDVTDPGAPSRIFERAGAVADVRMAGALAAVARTTAASLRVDFFDLRDRANPAIVNSIDFEPVLDNDVASAVLVADSTFVYVAGTQGAPINSGFFVIGQHNRPVDPYGFPPFIFAGNIYDGAPPLQQLHEGVAEVFTAVADDVAIASVKIFVNGQLAVTRNTPSSRQWDGSLEVPIPIEADSATITLEVTDVGGNVTSRTATLAVNPFLPGSGMSIGYASLPGDIATDGRNIWITLPDNTDGFDVQHFLGNVDGFFTLRAGLARPTYAAVDGEERAWITNVGNNTVVVTGKLGGLVRNISSIPLPGRMFFDGTHMWVVSGSLIVKKIDPNTFAEVGSFFTGGINPGLMAFDGTHLWVVNHGSNNIAKMRANDGVVLTTIPTGVNVTGIAFDGTHLWIVNGGDNTISVVRASDHATVATLPTGAAPAGIAFDGRYMYVTNSGDNNATKFRVSDRVALGTLFTGQQPTKVVTAGGYLWILNAGAPRYIGVYRLR